MKRIYKNTTLAILIILVIPLPNTNGATLLWHLVILLLKCNLARTDFTQVAVENLHAKDVVPFFKFGR